MSKKSFIIHKDSLEVLDKLTNEQAGELFKAIKSHQLEEDYEVSDLIDLVFTPFKSQFNRDDEKYEKLCEKNRLIAVNRHSTKSTSGTSGNQSLPKVTKSTDNDSDSKKDSDNDNGSKSKRFIKPALEEIKAYFIEKNYNLNPEDFFNHYEANGWMRGKTKIKDWKACARTWLKNDNNQAVRKMKEL